MHSQLDPSGDPFLSAFNLQGVDVTEGDYVELDIGSILDLVDDELKAELGELEVLDASIIRDNHEMFLGKCMLVICASKLFDSV
jgi:hypothetical protein